jgi:hypothetical protein
MKVFYAQEAITPSEKLTEYIAGCLTIYNAMTLEDNITPSIKELYVLGDCILVVDNDNLIFSVQVQNLPVED